MFKGNIGTRTGRNVLEGKEIHCDSAGFDDFDDYFTDSACASPEKTNIETVRPIAIKSFLTTEKSVHDGDSPLSKLPSKKRLSFKGDIISDSDSSSITYSQPRSRIISKRGMQSFPGEDEEVEKISLSQYNPSSASEKRLSSPTAKGYVSQSQSEKSFTKRISKRGMKSFPDDDNDVDLIVYDSSEYLSSEPVKIQKQAKEEQISLSSDGGKENEENSSQSQNNEISKQLPLKLSSQISPSKTKVNNKSGEKISKCVPFQNWYLWKDDSLIDRNKIIITPYGVHQDTGVKNPIQDLGTNLQVIDEEEPPQLYKKNWKSKLPYLDLLERNYLKSSESSSEKETETQPEDVRQETVSKRSSPAKKARTYSPRKSGVKQKSKTVDELLLVPATEPSEESSESLPDEDKTSEAETLRNVDVELTNEESTLRESVKDNVNQEMSTDFTTSTDDESRKQKDKKRLSLPKVRVLPRRQKTCLRKMRTPGSRKRSLNKQSPASSSTKSSSLSQGKRKSTSSSAKLKPVLTANKKPRTSEKKKVLPKSKNGRSIIPKRKNSSVPKSLRKRKSPPSRSPENKVGAKRAKILNAGASPSNYNTRSPSKGKKDSLSPTKKDSLSPTKKFQTQKSAGRKSNPEQCLSDDNEPHVSMSFASAIPSDTTQELTAYKSLRQSETENSQAILLGFNSSPSNLSPKDSKFSTQGSNKSHPQANNSDRIDILEVFDSKQFNPKLAKTNEKTKEILISPSNEGRGAALTAHPKPEQKRSRSSTAMEPPTRRRRTSGPLSSEDSLMICTKGFSRRLSAEKLKSPAKSNFLSKDLNVSLSLKEPDDWQCQSCHGLIPQCLMTCIFCGFQRQQNHQEFSCESLHDSQEESSSNWECDDCQGLIPFSLDACIFCGLSKRNIPQGPETQISPNRISPSSFYRDIFSQFRGKNNKASPKMLKGKTQKRQKTAFKPLGSKSKSEFQEFLKSSLNKNQSTFAMKSNYTFNSYEDINVDHKISYCVCSQSEKALVGMMKIKKGGYRNPNSSLKEMFFTVLEGRIKVQIDCEKQELSIHDSFVVAKHGEYSIENASPKTACLIFTIIK